MICVVTCRRKSVSYLGDTLLAIDSSAQGRRVVVSDNEAHRPGVPRPWELITFRKPVDLGPRPENRWTMWHCFKLAAEAAEDLVLLEDDLAICKNGAMLMERLGVPDDCAFLSFFCIGGVGMANGIHRARMHAFCYAQALKFPLRTVIELHEAFGEMARDPRVPGADDVLQRIGRQRGWLYGMHFPNIVQHVGEVSAVGIEGSRTSPTFPGEEFDAWGLRRWQYT